MQIKDIIKSTKGKLIGTINENDTYGKIKINSKEINETDIFIAIIGENNDGHDYINEAINSVHCYGFLTKPYLPNDVFQMLDSISQKKTSAILKLKNSDCIYREINFSDILLIESHLHYLHYHTQNNVHRSRQYTMKQLETILPNYFVRCHKSYLVNRHFISSYDPINRRLHLANHATLIPVGRNYRDTLYN